MKLEEGERLIAVHTCTDEQDVLLATPNGKCIRFEVPDVRVFAGRTSTGVRGIRLADGDEVMSMSIIDHVDATPDERAAYLKYARAKRGSDDASMADEPEEETTGTGDLSPERAQTLEAAEQFILTVSDRGFGKRTSAYEYRLTGRGGQGIQNMEVNERNGRIVATFPVREGDGIMLVSDGGQVIRTTVGDIRIAGRRTQGVTVFRVAADEHVVSVARLSEDAGEDEDGNGSEEASLDGEAPETPQ